MNENTTVDKRKMTEALTDLSYWNKLHQKHISRTVDATVFELIETIDPWLEKYKGGSFIEIGCVPGYISGIFGQRHRLNLYGIDFSPSADIYLKTAKELTGREAILYRSDIRDFRTEKRFDVVASFGIIEHFSDPEDVLDTHLSLCRDGGLVVVSVPNFRKLQWLYHAMFDNPDLKRHNTGAMTTRFFHAFAERNRMEICFLGHSGRIAFWNWNNEGSVAGVAVRRVVSGTIRLFTRSILRHILPAGIPLYAPWLIFIGKRSTT